MNNFLCVISSLFIVSLVFISGCQGSKVIYPLGHRDNSICDSIVGKWQGSYNDQFAYIETSYDSKKGLLLINIETENKNNKKRESFIPLQAYASTIGGCTYLCVTA